MTPLEIEILIHYYCTGGLDFPRACAPACAAAITEFVALGLLAVNPSDQPNTPHYTGNREALEPYIAAICAVPLPVIRWVMPEAPRT